MSALPLLPFDSIPVEVDAVVIGGGLAGGMAALRLASAGFRTVVFDRTAHPREKVCGCCLAPAGIAVLARCGLAGLLSDASPLEDVLLEAEHRAAVIEPVVETLFAPCEIVGDADTSEPAPNVKSACDSSPCDDVPSVTTRTTRPGARTTRRSVNAPHVSGTTTRRASSTVNAAGTGTHTEPSTDASSNGNVGTGGTPHILPCESTGVSS